MTPRGSLHSLSLPRAFFHSLSLPREGEGRGEGGGSAFRGTDR
jgi:hypothetical protein